MTISIDDPIAPFASNRSGKLRGFLRLLQPRAELHFREFQIALRPGAVPRSPLFTEERRDHDIRTLIFFERWRPNLWPTDTDVTASVGSPLDWIVRTARTQSVEPSPLTTTVLDRTLLATTQKSACSIVRHLKLPNGHRSPLRY